MEGYTPLCNDQKSASILQKMETIDNVSTVPVVQQQKSKITIPMLLGPTNTVTTCPHCESIVRTGIKHTTTTRTHLVAIFSSFLCCCCCFPYCCNSTRNTDHYCPSCQKYLGTYEK